MKPPRVLLIAIACLLGPVTTQADCQATGCYTVSVEQLVMTASNGFWIQTSGTETLATCTPDSGVFLYVPSSTAQLKELYATLLAAQLADKLVSIVINQGTNPCSVSYVNLNRQ